jgi:hypothetical protein
VPWKIAFGSSGVLPHLAALVIFAPVLLRPDSSPPSIRSLAVMLVGFSALFAAIGGARRKRAVLAPAIGAALLLCGAAFGLRTAALDLMSGAFGTFISRYAEDNVVAAAATALSLAAAAFVGAFVFGAYLAVLTLLGQENTQAFTALDHPGFKHFVRLRVRADGSAIDGWCLGLVDPLRAEEPPVIVDSFTWNCR